MIPWPHASDSVGSARTLPADWYLGDEVARREAQTVFGARWQCVARSSDLAAPGTFVAGQAGVEPYVVVRGEDGVLRAFANACRHAGTALASGCGRATQLACPYHGWRYDLDGRLRSAPRTAGLEGFRREDFGLVPMGVHEWGPLVLIRPAGEGVPPVLGPLPDRLDASRWSSLRHHSSKSYDLDCNWKVFVDNYLDGGYHVASLHPDLASELDLDTYRTELYDRCSVQTAPAAQSASVRLQGEAIYAWVYPNLMINRYGPMLDTNVVFPTGPQTCRVAFDWYFDADCSADLIARSLQSSEQVQVEDIEICAAVQRGMRSRHFRPGPYAPRVEMAKHHFHQLLARDLGPLPSA